MRKTECARSSRESPQSVPSHAAKDFRVCLVLNALYKPLPAGYPRSLFTGGAYCPRPSDIERISEDIDLAVHRNGLDKDRSRSEVSTRPQLALRYQSLCRRPTTRPAVSPGLHQIDRTAANPSEEVADPALRALRLPRHHPDTGRSALSRNGLLDAIRNHNPIAFGRFRSTSRRPLPDR